MSVNPLITCQSISKSYGPQALFSQVSLGFFENERLALIGPNGSGKTTLLKILADLESPSSGKVSRKRKLNLFYLPQADELNPERTIGETIFQDQPALMESWVSNRSLRETIETMGFDNLEEKISTLSGGWRKRVAVTQALIAAPDLLLMDEPTNHLDLEGILSLERLLKSRALSFVLVSHDRTFLENTCNRIVELNKIYPDGFIKVEGSYSTFLKKRAETLNEQKRHEESLSSKVRREIEWLKRGPKARTTKAKHRIQEAGELQKALSTVQTRNAQNSSAQIDFEASGRKTKKLIETKDLGIVRSGKQLFQGLNLTLSAGFCLGILGRNGSGKSTLIHLFNDLLSPDTGSIKKADGLKIVTFGQEREQLNQNQLLKDALAPEGGEQVIYQGRSIHIVSWAKRFLFSPQQLGLPVSRLSGGEQARVLIAKLMLEPADILLLDEPTNDLDIPTLEILEERLEAFTGAMILITHDRYLLNRLSHRLLCFEGNGKTAFYADLHQWEVAQKDKTPKNTSKKESTASKKEVQPSQKNKLSYSQRKDLSRIENKIEKASEKVDIIQTQIAAPEIQSDSAQLIALSEALRDAKEKVDSLYQEWENLEALESKD